MRAAFVLAAAALCACDTPPLKIVYHVADSSSGPSCGTADCADIPMPCDSVLSVRILRPSDPTAPFVRVCQEIPPNATKDLCAIAKIDLPPTELPREVLEVQVTVWPKSMVTNADGELDCLLVPITFDAAFGYPVTQDPGGLGPALGGRAYYRPGDTETDVTLGCSDKSLINAPSCSGADKLDVTATVGDFEILPFRVSNDDADQLNVFFGEPEAKQDGAAIIYELNPIKTDALDRTGANPPAWGAKVAPDLKSSACIEVIDSSSTVITTSIQCHPVNPADLATSGHLNISGVRVPEATLQKILTAISLTMFPDGGLTIGVVLDQNGVPAANVTVTSDQGTVEYLNATRTGLSTTGKTTSSGIFLSRNAPYNTYFGATLSTQVAAPQIGGLVEKKLTVVVLDFSSVVGG